MIEQSFIKATGDDLNEHAKVLELGCREVLSRNSVQDRFDTVIQDLSREDGPSIQGNQSLQTLLGFLLDRQFILEEVLEVRANDLGLDLHSVEVHPSFEIYWVGLWRGLVGLLSDMSIKLFVPILHVFSDRWVSDDVAQKLQDVHDQIRMDADVRVDFMKLFQVFKSNILRFLGRPLTGEVLVDKFCHLF